MTVGRRLWTPRAQKTEHVASSPCPWLKNYVAWLGVASEIVDVRVFERCGSLKINAWLRFGCLACSKNAAGWFLSWLMGSEIMRFFGARHARTR